jgi:predicted transglutaminase-like cysteine proteinase
MSTSARLCRLGTLLFAVTQLLGCSQTANLSQGIAPEAPAPQSITSQNYNSTATRCSQWPGFDSESSLSTATQIVPQAVIPPSVASALAAGLNSEDHEAKASVVAVTPTVPTQSIESSELFGESANSSNQPFQRWLNVLARFNEERHSPQYACSSGTQQTCALAWWSDFVTKLRALPLRERVVVANDVLNRVPYVPGESNWGDPGYWETPLEFLTRAGQCQDYANAKYLALAESGVPDALMRFVVVRDKEQALDHAVLVVYVDNEPLVLDNQNTAVLPAEQIERYAPYYALNAQASWIYPLPVHPIFSAEVAAFPHPAFELARY